MTERCEIRRCRAEAAITYLDHGICDRHWNQLTAEEAPSDALRIALGIETPVHAATEGRTMEPEKSSKKTKATPKAKAAKVKAPKEPKALKEPLVVFAFRLKPEERDAIHEAAGPGKATRFVLAAALAAAKQVRTEK